MSSNGIVGLTSLSNDIDLVSKKYVNSNYVDNNFKKELIKVLEEGLKEISERLYSIEVTIENKKKRFKYLIKRIKYEYKYYCWFCFYN